MNPLALIAMLLLASLSLKLALQDSLTLYVHPRYVGFVIIMNLICLAAAVTGLAVYAIQKGARAPARPSILTVGVLVLILVALIVPPQPLQSNIVDKRYIAFSSESTSGNCTEPPANTKPSSFQNWKSLLASCSNPEIFKDMPVDLTGFIYEDRGSSTTTTFPIARFMVSCCAIDAQPLVMLVKEDNWASKYQANDWVNVKGYIGLETVYGKKRAVIVPQSIQKVEVPRRPYEFIGQ